MQQTVHDKKIADFNTLYTGTRDDLFYFLGRYSKDLHLVEDIMQQCYLKLWERMDSLHNLQDARPLVRTYARNLLIDVIRRRMKEDTLWLDQLQPEAEKIIDTAISISGEQQLFHLEAAINQLPESTRTVYLLHRENGLSYKEIASRLSISVSMVEKHMSKAIRFLKIELLTDTQIILIMIAGSELLK